ncbi:head GIN domain-containing protein [Ramlibacter algicola]|uniref:DUF2807 domain-containing protein n=1 Tax=Ramlibacter algicola TaxID=2795217 RepID=A0A934PYN6_9BURK|nr:head GIN domain-containing protein [Ramlibacter algicola]MBK0392899.1 DUF2807 domain-containing protein [Ramlibacter algicola]
MSGPAKPRRRIVVLFATALALAGVTAVAATSTVKGNGNRRSETRTVSGFTGVASALPGQLEVRLGNAESVVIETDDNLLPLIESKVVRGTLELRPQRDISIDPQYLKVVVTARSIDMLALAGSGSLTADGLKGQQLKVDVGGSGSIDLARTEVDSLAISMGGSGAIKLGGTARELKLSLAGSGNVSAGALQADEARISIAGSGVATVAPKSRLKVSIAGSGNVRYQGDPKVEQSIAGSGTVQRL